MNSHPIVEDLQVPEGLAIQCHTEAPRRERLHVTASKVEVRVVHGYIQTSPLGQEYHLC